jgi:hypothetical protein
MSDTKDPIYSDADDTYPDKGYKKHETLNSGIPDDGPALLLLNYDIVFVVSRPKLTSTKPHYCFCSTGR